MDVSKPPRRKRIMRWALALSLGVNLVFVGLFAGAAYRNAGGPGAPWRGEGPGMRNYATPYVQALPRETRRELHLGLRRGDGQAKPLSREERRALYQQMLSVLRADSFDPTAAKNVLSAQRDAILGVQSAAQAAWLDEIAQMDAPERAAYADELEKVLKRGPRKRRGNKPKDE
ncbi:MAG: periplasmic heavy metal sensor [Sulfitobacter sp.]